MRVKALNFYNIVPSSGKKGKGGEEDKPRGRKDASAGFVAGYCTVFTVDQFQKSFGLMLTRIVLKMMLKNVSKLVYSTRITSFGSM